jgi:hypothetical protein
MLNVGYTQNLERGPMNKVNMEDLKNGPSKDMVSLCGDA